MSRPRVVIMVKEPLAGRVKTRLARDIGVALATRFYRRTSACIAMRLAAESKWTCSLAVSPDRPRTAWRWPGAAPWRRQGGGSLGDRMERLLRSPPAGPIVVVGSDIPGVDRRRVGEAFRTLRGHDAVFGPAEDGGFWLVGLRRWSRRASGMFRGVRWSSGSALGDALRNLDGWRIGWAAKLGDVDNGADFRRLGARSVRLISRR